MITLFQEIKTFLGFYCFEDSMNPLIINNSKKY